MNSTIVDRIRKLLRLARSPNAHEAALAADRAFELAARHSIEIDSLDLDERERKIVHESIRGGRYVRLERRLAARIVKTFFNVAPIFDRNQVLFVGTATDIKIAVYVFEFLATTAAMLVRQHRREFGRHWTANRRRSFLFGFFYGVTSRLNATRNSIAALSDATALALVVNQKAARDAYIAQALGAVVPVQIAAPRRRNLDAMTAGYLAGHATEISPAIETTEAPRALPEACVAGFMPLALASGAAGNGGDLIYMVAELVTVALLVWAMTRRSR